MVFEKFTNGLMNYSGVILIVYCLALLIKTENKKGLNMYNFLNYIYMNAKGLITKYFTCIVIASLFFVSCEKEDVKSIENSSNISLSNKEKYDEYGQKLFSVVLKSLEDKEFKSFIKEEALKQFDGDYDILIASSLDKPVNGNLKSTSRTLKEYLLGKIEASNLKSSEEGTSNFLDSILLYCPLMQISVPELGENSTENWDVENDNVLLTFLPSDFDEKTYTFVEAYDKSGNYYKLSLDSLPEIPVIVISNNERLEVDQENNFKSSKINYYSNQYYSYSLIYNDEEIIENDLNSTNLKSTQAIDRDTKTGKDVLYKGIFESKDAFRQVESWPNGKPEFKVIIVYSDRNGSTFTANSVEKVLSKDGWIKRYVVTVKLQTKTINVPIMTWYRDRFGLYMKYRWIEKDSGNSTEISTTLNNKYDDNTSTTTTVKSTVSDKDDDAGEAIVEYEDPTSGDGTWYSTGIVKFSVNQQ